MMQLCCKSKQRMFLQHSNMHNMTWPTNFDWFSSSKENTYKPRYPESRFLRRSAYHVSFSKSRTYDFNVNKLRILLQQINSTPVIPTVQANGPFSLCSWIIVFTWDIRTVKPRYPDTLQTRKKCRHERSVAVIGVTGYRVFIKSCIFYEFKTILNFISSCIFKQ